MPTRALLLCADEKALAAITQVLSELGVPFEQPADPASVGKRLASQRFDVILIDCDHESWAAQAFDLIRKSSLNQSAMTLAIVDGKAGVPGAFRLGARLVLTKPVSLEQARGTLRNALAIQRREVPENKAAAPGTPQETPVEKAAGSAPTPAAPVLKVAPQSEAPAALKPASWERPKPDTAPAPLARAAAAGTGIQDRITEVAPPPAFMPSPRPAPLKKEAVSAPLPKPARATDRSPEDDDLLMCELEDDLDSRKRPTTRPTKGRAAPRRTSPALIALLVVLLLGAGVYALWTMKPGFRAAVLAQYGKLHLLIAGRAANPPAAAPTITPRPIPAQPSAKPSNPAGKAGPSAAPAGAPVPEGFLAAQTHATAATPEGASGKPAAQVAAASDADSDRGPLTVAAELADQHVSHRVAPVYPEWARQKRLEGNVVLRAAVNDDGSVDSVQVLDGHPRLVAAAVEAVRQWRFELYYHNSQPSAFQTEVTVKFELPKKKAH